MRGDRCVMCGNEGAEVPVIATRNYASAKPEEMPWVCTRCAEVIKDRTRNVAHGLPLLRSGETTIWTDGTSTEFEAREMVR